MQKWIAAQLAFLKSKAQAKKDPEAWIDYILDNDEEPGCRAIITALSLGATFENLLAFDPEIAQNPELLAWFKTLYDGIASEIRNAGDVDSARAAGDSSNVVSNARFGATGGGSDPGPSAG